MILREPMGVKTKERSRQCWSRGERERGRPAGVGVPSRGSDCPLRLPGRGGGGSRQPGAPRELETCRWGGAEAVAGAGTPSRAQGELLGDVELKRLLSAAEAGKTLLVAGADLRSETRQGVWAAPGHAQVRAESADFQWPCCLHLRPSRCIGEAGQDGAREVSPERESPGCGLVLEMGRWPAITAQVGVSPAASFWF